MKCSKECLSSFEIVVFNVMSTDCLLIVIVIFTRLALQFDGAYYGQRHVHECTEQAHLPFYAENFSALDIEPATSGSSLNQKLFELANESSLT